MKKPSLPFKVISQRASTISLANLYTRTTLASWKLLSNQLQKTFPSPIKVSSESQCFSNKSIVSGGGGGTLTIQTSSQTIEQENNTFTWLQLTSNMRHLLQTSSPSRSSSGIDKLRRSRGFRWFNSGTSHQCSGTYTWKHFFPFKNSIAKIKKLGTRI